jgi:hypothetical protein
MLAYRLTDPSSRRRKKYLEQPGCHIRRISVTVNQIGLEGAQKAASLHEASHDARRVLAHIEADEIERGGPLMRLAASKNDERDRMTARRHALPQRHCLAFRSADAQRCEHIRDPHSTRTLQKDKVK